ncbi:MAG: hypothetical protein M0Q88_08620 [Bacilli bacterium]|nr:hypothetical protein [Bacilli bacterium]
MTGKQLTQALGLSQLQEQVDDMKRNYSALKTEFEIALSKLSNEYDFSKANNPENQPVVDRLNKTYQALNSQKWDIEQIVKRVARDINQVAENFDFSLLSQQEQLHSKLISHLKNNNIDYETDFDDDLSSPIIIFSDEDDKISLMTIIIGINKTTIKDHSSNDFPNDVPTTEYISDVDNYWSITSDINKILGR